MIVKFHTYQIFKHSVGRDRGGERESELRAKMEEQEREGEDDEEDEEGGLECKSGASQCSRLSEAARSPANAREGEAAQTTDRTNAHSLPPASTSGSMEV